MKRMDRRFSLPSSKSRALVLLPGAVLVACLGLIAMTDRARATVIPFRENANASARVAAPAVAPPMHAREWTMGDLDAVAEAGMATAAATPVLEQLNLEKLADALAKSGARSLATQVILKAAAGLQGDDPIHRWVLIEHLVQFDDRRDAERLANAVMDPTNRSVVLGKLGAAEGRAGDVQGALKADAAIEALKAPPSPEEAFVLRGRAEVALGLADGGAVDEALHIVNGLPPGMAKVTVEAGAAGVICTRQIGGERDLARGSRLAQVSADDARAAIAALPADERASKAWDRIYPAAEALARCDGAAAVRTFVTTVATEVPDKAADMLWQLADELTDRGQFQLAAGLAPAPDPANVEKLTAASRLSINQRNLPAARVWALQALQVGRARSAAAKTASVQDDGVYFDLQRVFTDLGDYDAALSVLQLIDVDNRNQFYPDILQAEIDHHDSAAITRTLRIAIAAIVAPSISDPRTALEMRDMTEALAIGGYRAEARTTFDALRRAPDWSETEARDAPELQAALGDLPGALKAADKLGDLVTPPGDLPALVAATIALGEASPQKPPTLGEVSELAAKVRAAEPQLVAGAKAGALSRISVVMAQLGDIDGAWKAEQALEVSPRGAREAVAFHRDRALAAIAEAQLKASDPHSALKTALLMSPSDQRMDLLLKLAAIPPRS